MNKRKLLLILLILLIVVFPSLHDSDPVQAQGSIFVVNSTADIDDDTLNDGICKTEDPLPDGSDQCTLRAAIRQANATPATDVIWFNIPTTDPGYNASTGAFTIRPSLGALPKILSPLDIDGYSQPGAVANTGLITGTNATLKVELNGALIAPNALGTIGLDVVAPGSIIQGLVINGFTRAGIYVRGGLINASPPGVQITGNFIGTDVTGYAAVPNHTGIDIAASSDNTMIGGASPENRNLVSGNTHNGIAIGNGIATDNVVAGNLIGTERTGAAALPNQLSGILISSSFGFNGFPSNNTIGGTQNGARNIISGNGRAGIEIFNGANNTIIGNFIGTDPSGDNPVPNGYGIDILNSNSTNNTIGGTTPEERNIISGNSKDGIRIAFGAESNTIIGNYIGTTSSGSNLLPNGDNGIRVEASNNTTIGGDTDFEANVISGNTEAGILLDGTIGTDIRSNLIGTTDSGGLALPNSEGIELRNSNSNLISGSPTGRLVIAGNNNAGIRLQYDSHGNQIYYAYIGTSDGTDVLPNGIGIVIEDGSSANEIGDGTAENRNIISGNLAAGIVLSGADTQENSIKGNYIGPDNTGLAPLAHPSQSSPLYGNLGNGIVIKDGATNNIIGGETSEGNLISGNSGNGILIEGAETNNNYIQSNIIGGDINNDCTADPNSGDCFMGNGGYGILIKDQSNNNLLGGFTEDKGNTITYNGYTLDLQGHGIQIESGIGNTIRHNSIYQNHGRGINLVTPANQLNSEYAFTINDPQDADSGPNHLQNYPVVTDVQFSGGQKTIEWTLYSVPNYFFVIDIFANDELDPSGFGEGKEYLATQNISTDTKGKAVFSFTTSTSNTYISTTTTGLDGSTSEFSIVDTDGDAIADAWESPGMGLNIDENSDENGSPIIDLDLSVMGADPEYKDIFVEIDAMNGLAPSQFVLDWVTTTFEDSGLVQNPNGLTGIALHFETSQVDLQIPVTEWTQTSEDGWPPEFDNVKNLYFGDPLDRFPGNSNSTQILNAKRLIFRYGLFANNVGPGSTSGKAEIGGNDFIVSLGRWTDSNGNPGGNDAEKAGTLVHELGHVLGLYHGGQDEVNCKPNYHSVMNYIWQFPKDAYMDSWTLNYSDMAFSTIDENTIDTQAGIGGHSGHTVPIGPIIDSEGDSVSRDFVNESGPWPLGSVEPNDPNIPAIGSRDVNFQDTNCIEDKNNDGQINEQDSERTILASYSDWDHLIYYFHATDDFLDGNHVSDVVVQEITIETNEALNTIGNGPGTLEFSHLLHEATELDGYAEVRVVRAAGTEGAVTVDYATTSGGTAVSGVDFLPVSGTLTFPDLVHVQTFTIPVTLDALSENSETIEVVLSDPTVGTGLGTYTTLHLTLYDDQEPGTLEFAQVYTFANEDSGQAAVEIVRTGGQYGSVSVTFNTADNTALSGSDYTTVNQTVTFGSGEITKTVLIPLTNDANQEYTEFINLSLSNPSGGAQLGQQAQAQLHILDDELPSTYVVVNTADSGTGSLRQAIINANNSPGLDTILFDIPGGGVQTIQPLTVLPTITGPIIIDGYSQPGAAPNTLADGSDAVLLVELDGRYLTYFLYDGLELLTDDSVIRGLVVHSFPGHGIDLRGSNNLVEGSYIGTDPTGSLDMGNGKAGIAISSGSNNLIGGGQPASRNIISGNDRGGVDNNASSATGSVVQGNYIGVQADGLSPLGNGDNGIQVNGANALIGGLLPGQGNIIAYNQLDGISGTGSGKPTVLSNSIFANGEAGYSTRINRGVNQNVVDDVFNTVNYPILSSAIYEDGRLLINGRVEQGRANTDYLIQFFANDEIEISGYGEAKTYLGAVTVQTDSNGQADFTISLDLTLPAGQFMVASATDFSRGTSEYSARLAVGDTPTAFAVVNTTDDLDDGICDHVHCSLREAIFNANNHPGQSFISFNIGSGQQTIQPLAPLPAVIGPTFIDGASQPGFAGTPIIELDGSQVDSYQFQNDYGLWLVGGGSVVRSLVINQFSVGIGLGNGTTSYEGLGGNVIQGNYIGTDVSGLAAAANGTGIAVNNAPDNLIGGTTAAERNLISGNTSDGIRIQASAIYLAGQFVELQGTDNIIQGNYIGVDATGGQPLGNGGRGLYVDGARTIVGGHAPGAGNVIAANGSDGIYMPVRPEGNGNLILGNLIGTDATVTQPMGNGTAGIWLQTFYELFSGSLPGVQIANNVIAGSSNAAIRSLGDGDDRVHIQDNYIGTNISGTVAFANNGGIDLSGSNNLIEGNLVSGNQSYGIRLVNASTISNSVTANLIGVQADGLSPLGNAGDGLLFANGASNNSVLSNTIAFNGGNGVTINDTAVQNTLSANSIHSNTGLGIDLYPLGVNSNDTGDADSGANNLQNYPFIVSAESGTDVTIVTVALNSAASTDFRVELYSSNSVNGSGFGEGQQYLQSFSLTTQSNGARLAQIILPGELPVGTYVTALATDPNGNSSEFSAAVQVTDLPQPPEGAEYANETDLGRVEIFDDAPPVAVPGGPYTTGEGQTITLDGSGSFPIQGSITAYAWDLDNDGLFDDATGATAAFTPVDNGLVTVTLQVTDNMSQTAEAATLITVLNVAPTVNAGLSQSVEAGTPLNLTATFTDPGLLDTHTAVIDWGDGITETAVVDQLNYTVSGQHTYTTDGAYQADTCVTDSDGDTDCDLLTVYVQPPPQNADLVITQTDSLDPVGVGVVVTHTFTVDNLGPSTAEEVEVFVELPTSVNLIGYTSSQGSCFDFDGEFIICSLNDMASGSQATVEAAVVSNTPGFFILYGEVDSITDDPNYSNNDSGEFTTAVDNQAPVAVDDSLNGVEDTPLTIDVLANDSDADGDPLTVTAVSQPANGSAVINPDNTITYTPDPDYNLNDSAGGPDTFSYTLSDGVTTATATVAVTVSPVNDNPTAADDNVTTNEDTAVILAPLTNDSDVDGDAVTITSIDTPALGSLADNGDGTYTYIPAADISGTDAFSYTVGDGNGGTAAALVTVTIVPANDAPVAVDDTAVVDEDSVVIVPVLDNDSDVDGDTLQITAVSVPSNGAAIDNGDGTITYTPAADFNGSDSFTYTTGDGQGGMSTATVLVTVNPVNDDPVAQDDSAAVLEDTQIILDVLANDSDVDGDALTVSITAAPQNGTAVVNPSTGSGQATISYTPAASFNGTDTLTYAVDDGNGGTDSALVTLNVTPGNDNPDALDDEATTAEDTAVAVDVLANDGDPLTVTAVTTPTSGLVTINPDSTLTYTPTQNFNGDVSFAYTVGDGFGGSDTALVTIHVTPVNDDPTASDDSAATSEDIATTVNVLANDVDVDGDALTVTAVTTPTNGAAAINPDGTITYQPDSNFNGSDSLVYTVSDSFGGQDTAVLDLTVMAVNDEPLATDDMALTTEDTAVTIPVLNNDSDVDGDSLVVTNVTVPANGTAVFLPAPSTGSGQATIVYTPTADFNGADSFSYSIADGNGGTASATVYVAVQAVNDDPVAANDSQTTGEDTAVTFDVLANDGDIDGDLLAVSSVSAPANGTVTTNPDGSLTYTPDADFNGTDSFGYVLSDGNGGSDTAVVTIIVNPVNDDPVATDDAIVTPEDRAVTVDVLANDGDVDGDALTVTAVTTPTNGTAVINPDGTVTYTPASEFFGADSFSYTLEDGFGGTDTATVTVTVSSENDNPVAVADAAATNEDTAVTISVLSNDSDLDGDPLTVSSLTQPVNGTAAVNSDGTVTYIPATDYFGTDSFVYTISDGQGGSDSAVVNVTVQAVNDAPVAVDDVALTAQDTAVTVPVLLNDSDIEGDALTVNGVGTAVNGTASLNPDGTITYAPDPGFFGTDSFTYNLNDGQGGTATATVTITVFQANDSCELYPISLQADILNGAQPGDILTDILNGEQPGNFGWLTWNGNNSTSSLIASLTPPGNSNIYVNPNDPNDQTVSAGDWVQGKPGVSNARSVRDALDLLMMTEIVVPIWDVTQGNGANAVYHITGFARVRILDYNLAGQDELTVEFLGFTTCN